MAGCSGSLTDPVARVYELDGQVVHERKGFRASELALPVVIPLEGHKTISLEVDYGANEDVQDRFDWIEPAMLKFKPK